jgi:hypothetical protein
MNISQSENFVWKPKKSKKGAIARLFATMRHHENIPFTKTVTVLTPASRYTTALIEDFVYSSMWSNFMKRMEYSNYKILQDTFKQFYEEHSELLYEFNLNDLSVFHYDTLFGIIYSIKRDQPRNYTPDISYVLK